MSDQPIKNHGLRGVKVGYAYTSYVDPERGVHYLGEPINELYNLDACAVYQGMLSKSWPSSEAFRRFKAQIVERRQAFPLEICEQINANPQTHPMERLIQGLVQLGSTRGTYQTGQPQYHQGVLDAIAWTPLLCVSVVTAKTPSIAKDYRSYGQILAAAMDLDRRQAHFLDQFATIHADHGGGNLSTFVAKAAASGYVDIWFALAAGMIGLYGERHGKANQQSLAQLMDFQKQIAAGKSLDQLIEETFESGKAMFGFGHAVLRQEDPRAKIFYQLADELVPQSELYQIARALREKWPAFVEQEANPRRIAQGKTPISNPYPNVDQLSGAVLWELGFRDPRSFTVLFALGRLPCIAAQLAHEADEKVPIYRPTYPYGGEHHPLPTGEEYEALLAPTPR